MFKGPEQGLTLSPGKQSGSQFPITRSGGARGKFIQVAPFGLEYPSRAKSSGHGSDGGVTLPPSRHGGT